MSYEVGVWVKYSPSIVDRLKNTANEIVEETNSELRLRFSPTQFSIHNKRFRNSHKEKGWAKGHGFTAYVNIEKEIITFIAPFDSHNFENAKDTIKDLSKWIRKNFQKAKIIGADWSGTAGYAKYKYSKGKWLLEGYGDGVEEKTAKMD